MVRHHVLTLFERISRWREAPARRAQIVGPTTYWVESLDRAIATDRRKWVNEVLSRSPA